jgi:hypothetical protein
MPTVTLLGGVKGSVVDSDMPTRDVHWRNMEAVLQWVEDTYSSESFWHEYTELHIWTDGCGEQYKGRRNFRYLAEAALDSDAYYAKKFGKNIFWNFACSHHFAGTWDGEGGKAKTHCANAKDEDGKGKILDTTSLCVQHLNDTFTRTDMWEQKNVGGFYWGDTYSINQRHFIHYLSGDDARSDPMDADPVTGTQSHYQVRYIFILILLARE